MSFGAIANNMLVTCLRTLGINAEYIRALRHVEVRGVFDSDYTEIDPQSMLPVMSLGPCFGMRSGDVPGGEWQESDRLNVDGIEYEIIEAKPDSEGGVIMVLQRMSRYDPPC
ncbi:MAG: hypothetical protein Q4C86_07655 [bacterium]|nr:hypothetical protein [bacterium]